MFIIIYVKFCFNKVTSIFVSPAWARAISVVRSAVTLSVVILPVLVAVLFTDEVPEIAGKKDTASLVLLSGASSADLQPATLIANRLTINIVNATFSPGANTSPDEDILPDEETSKDEDTSLDIAMATGKQVIVEDPMIVSG